MAELYHRLKPYLRMYAGRIVWRPDMDPMFVPTFGKFVWEQNRRSATVKALYLAQRIIISKRDEVLRTVGIQEV